MVVQHDRAHEHEAQAHDRSAARYEQHAVILDRHGAHRSAKTERRYAADARQRMIYLRNLLAHYEISVAQFYMRRGAYVAAAAYSSTSPSPSA